MHNYHPLKIENVVVGEDVIVVKPSSRMHDKIGQIWKNGVRGELQKVSVSFEGAVCNFSLEELSLI